MSGTDLPVPSAHDRAVWTALDQPTLRRIEDRARAERGQAWPQPLAHLFARYFRDGDREAYEQRIWDHDRRLTRAAVLAAVTLDPEWLDEVTDGVILTCERSTWCWPAHDDTFSRHATVLPTTSEPYVDLGAGEVAAQLAWIDHLLGDHLEERTPGLRARVREEVDRRVLTPFEQRRDWHWLGLDGDVHNWNPWIHGNVLVATLALVSEPGRRARLVALVVDGLSRYADSLPADGAIDEGFAYWWNGACRLLEAFELLGRSDESLRETVAFPHRVHLGGDYYVNHADGPARAPADLPWHVLHRHARRAGDTDAEAHAAAHRRSGEPVADENQGLGRLLRALTDPQWAAAEPRDLPLPRDVWFPSTQVLIGRGAGGLTLVAKGGHNGEHHNHNDVGSFVVARDGVPVLIDPGRPTYTAQTFGPRRYEIWTMQSTWHNTPTIRGSAQHDGRRYAARDVRPEITGDHVALTLDLAAAYPRDDVRRWQRTARLDRAAGTITVRDSWDLDGRLDQGEGFTGVHLIIAGEVTVGEGWAETGGVRIDWRPAAAGCAVHVRDLDDPILAGVWGDRLSRLDIDVSGLGPVGRLELTVKEQR